jgi:hypothetical protein
MSTVVNQQYYFTYTITQYTSGKLQPKLGSTLLTERDSVGTYTEIVTCPTNGAKPIFVGGTVAFVGSIDDVQLTPVVTELALTNRAKYGSTRSTHYTGELVYYISTFGLSNMTTVNNYTTEYDGSYRPTVQLPLMLSNDPSWTGAVPIYIVEVEYAEANYNTVRQ